MWLFKKKSEEEKRAERLEKFKRGDVKEYNDYLSSPWRIVWTNFFAGAARGLGLVLGVALVVTIITFVISKFLSQIPVVGEFFSAINMWIQDTLRQSKP